MSPGQRFNPYRMFTGAFIPNWLLRRDELSLGAKVVYARLAQFAGDDGRAYPTVERLSAEVGTSARQVQRYLAELVANKLIERHGNYAEGKGDDFYFLAHEWFLAPVSKTSPPRCQKRHPPGDGFVTPSK